MMEYERTWLFMEVYEGRAGAQRQENEKPV